MEDNEKLTAERSLEIISTAIERSRREAGRSVGTMMTVWGVLSVAVGVAVALLWGATGDGRWNWLWAAAAVAAYAHYLYAKGRDKRRHTADTFATKVIKWVWTTFVGVAGCAVMFSLDLFYDAGAVGRLPVYPVVIFLLGLASGITGMVTSNGAGCGSAIMSICWAKTAVEDGGSTQAAYMAAACVFALLIPGFLMKYKYGRSNGKRKNERIREHRADIADA